MSKKLVSRAAYYLALIGGILMVLIGLLGFLKFNVPSFGFHFWPYGYDDIVTIVCGIIAIIGAKSVTHLVWAIVLIIVGIVGGGIGGLLVILGGIVGLVSALAKKA